MALWQWSTTPADNATAGAIDWAEGQPPSTVNDSARQMMADVAAWYAGPEWLNYGLTPTYISTTQFSVAGNQTALYTVGRRVRTFNSGGTVYGTISASVFTSVTTVTIVPDNSGSLDSGLSEVDVGMLNPAYASLSSLPGLTLNEPANGNSTLTVNAPNSTNGAGIEMIGNGTTTPNKYLRVWNGKFYIWNSTNTTALCSIDETGNFIAIGDITALSDERLKKDWESLPPDFVQRLANVKSGTYTRIDTGIRQVGVSAQSLLPVLQEAIHADDDERLSVAYGQAALAACVELAKEVIRLRALVEPVK
ncbi:tail fiber domain-containing protein [Pararobbsia silviterrae]|uniref:Tail fiber domain-containing protein n=1 Tax=Pararobbsia silviterrae TaxID=1792498 RepID=A0A494Y0R8_9BURK|nr:tail fiber domain-containing protein [Pararobbsia silviterrae]RKP56354.1 tail fiber domain-containing protein [Pararobbsia silviterrae]